MSGVMKQILIHVLSEDTNLRLLYVLSQIETINVFISAVHFDVSSNLALCTTVVARSIIDGLQCFGGIK